MTNSRAQSAGDLPRISQCPRAAVGVGIAGEFAIEFGEDGPVGARKSSAPPETRAELCGIDAPLTMKLVPGNDWNDAFSHGSLTKSCAQASLPRSTSGMLDDRGDVLESRADFGAHVGGAP